MKKKLLVIVLAFCCVWGVFAQQKLLDAIKNGDLNTVKTQIELLDVDVNEPVGREYLLDYAVEKWEEFGDKNSATLRQANSVWGTSTAEYYNRNFYEESGKFKAIIEYLVSKKALLHDDLMLRWFAPNASYNIYILQYLLDKKILNSDMMIGSGNKAVSIVHVFYGLHYEQMLLTEAEMRHRPWRAKFVLMSLYFPMPSDWTGAYTVVANLVRVLKNDLSGIKDSVKRGNAIDGNAQLFISNQEIADLLKATDNYKLTNYEGYVTPFYCSTIIPKYCTQCLTEDEIAIIKLIADYDASQPRDAAIEKVKAYIANGVDLKKNQYVLGGATIGDLPKMIGKFDDDDIVGEIVRAEEARIAAEEARIAAEKAEQERIAREKAEAERKEKEKIAEEKLEKEYLDTFIQQYKNQLDRFIKKSKKNKGKFILKEGYYTKDQMIAYGSPLKVVDAGFSIQVTYIYNGHIENRICSLSKSDGYTKDVVKKVLKKALDSFIVEE